MQVETESRMNQETISIAEAKRTFSELLRKVAYEVNESDPFFSAVDQIVQNNSYVPPRYTILAPF